jgi:hypothetical protein
MSTNYEEEFPPLVELGRPGRYSLPTATRALNVAMPSHKGPARIRLALEGEYELEIPATQHAIDGLYRVLQSMTTHP